jgi:hypothetical protein
MEAGVSHGRVLVRREIQRKSENSGGWSEFPLSADQWDEERIREIISLSRVENSACSHHQSEKLGA